MSSEVQAFLSGLATVGPAGLALIIITGALRLWVYGYIDKAKDVQIERLTVLLEKSNENNRTLLGIMETGKRGRS
jgi:hypothetical protein